MAAPQHTWPFPARPQLERFTQADGRITLEWLVPILDESGSRLAWRHPTAHELEELEASLAARRA